MIFNEYQLIIVYDCLCIVLVYPGAEVTLHVLVL